MGSVEELKKDYKYKTVPELVKELKTNAAFQMSLSGKELFHSNMIGMFLTQEEGVTNKHKIPNDIAKGLINLFPPKINDEKQSDYVVFDVLREYKHLDLLILYCKQDEKDILYEAGYTCVDDIQDMDKKKNEDDTDDTTKIVLPEDICNILKNMKYVIVENKFKSFPYKEQLDRYSEADINVFKSCKDENGKKIEVKNRTCYLLAPEGSLNSFYNTDKEFIHTFKNEITWEGVSYEKVRDALWENNNKDSKLMGLFIEEYCKFLTIMLCLYTKCIEKRLGDNKVFLSNEDNEELLKCRIQDFYEKIIFNRVLSKLRQENKVFFIPESPAKDSENIDDNWPFFNTGAGYSNQKGYLDFRYYWNNSSVTSGIEIQGSVFEIVFCATKDEFKKIVFGISANKGKKVSAYDDFLKKNGFEDSFKNFRGEGKNVSKENEIVSTVECIKLIYEKIKEKLNNDYPQFVKLPKELQVPKIKNSIVHSYETEKYTFRYLCIDLNEVISKKNNEEYNSHAYRDFEYNDLEILLKVALEVLHDNPYEKLKKQLEKK